MKPEGGLHRAPRPLILWCGVALVAAGVVGLTIFLFRVGNAIADAFERSAHTGDPVPNMDGGLASLLTAIGAFIATIGPFVWQIASQRHKERMDQQARGTAPQAPFAPSPPSAPPFEGVNPHGGPNAP